MKKNNSCSYDRALNKIIDYNRRIVTSSCCCFGPTGPTGP